MKFRVERDVFADAVAWAARTLPVRPSAPVLTGLLIEAGVDGIDGLRLSDGTMVEADLFVDATGNEDLLNGLRRGKTHPAVASLIVDRELIARKPPISPLPVFSSTTAFPAGWVSYLPVPEFTGVRVAYCSSLVSDEAAARIAGLDGVSRITINHVQARPSDRRWLGNVVALPAARSGALAGLPGDLHETQIALGHLISLFPIDREHMPEADIYNVEVASFSGRFSDFAAAPLALNQRTADPLWNDLRARPVSDAFERSVELFAARGRIPETSHESFERHEWATMLVGMGVTPRSYDPAVDRLDQATLIQSFRQHLAEIRRQVSAMPTHEAALQTALAQ